MFEYSYCSVVVWDPTNRQYPSKRRFCISDVLGETQLCTNTSDDTVTSSGDLVKPILTIKEDWAGWGLNVDLQSGDEIPWFILLLVKRNHFKEFCPPVAH